MSHPPSPSGPNPTPAPGPKGKPAPGPAPAPKIPGYEVLERIGRGAMGVVYRARQTSVDRLVAVKVLRDELARDPGFIERFHREAKVAAKLSHPHIVGVIDAGEAAGRPYFVMEYVPGANVQDELNKKKVYPEREALEIVLAVARALEHAHGRGLVHRDIKPGNIILTGDGGVKLADLGLARTSSDAPGAEGAVAAGTPYYISPEQAKGRPDVDGRSDLYSLGATLYHMVTGRVPFQGATPAEVMRKHVSKKAHLVPPDHLNPNLSGGLGEVVETLMAKSRDERYQSAADLALDLESMLRGERPKLAEQNIQDLAVLSQGESEEFDPGTAGGPYRPGRRSRSNGPAVVILSILLGLSVLLNLVQFLSRK